MRVLSILRHAKSSWANPGAGDFDRALNDRGRKAAERMGRELRQCGALFDHVLASPAARVSETLDCLAQGYGALPDVEFDDRLYAASAGTLIGAIKALSGAVDAPLLVGHNPGLHQLLLALAEEGELRLRVADKFPTAAFATIELPALCWADVTPGTGRVRRLILPRALD